MLLGLNSIGITFNMAKQWCFLLNDALRLPNKKFAWEFIQTPVRFDEGYQWFTPDDLYLAPSLGKYYPLFIATLFANQPWYRSYWIGKNGFKRVFELLRQYPDDDELALDCAALVQLTTWQSFWFFDMPNQLGELGKTEYSMDEFLDHPDRAGYLFACIACTWIDRSWTKQLAFVSYKQVDEKRYTNLGILLAYYMGKEVKNHEIVRFLAIKHKQAKITLDIVRLIQETLCGKLPPVPKKTTGGRGDDLILFDVMPMIPQSVIEDM